MDPSPPTTFTINGIVADLASETLHDRKGSALALRPQAFMVLRHLLLNSGRLVTKDELIHTVWPATAVTDDSLVQCIHEVRRALKDDAHAVLKTVSGRGYRLVLPSESGGRYAGRRSARRGHRGSSSDDRWGRRPWWLLRSPSPPIGKPVVAVLPFANFGNDDATGRLADGLTEDIVTDLARYPEFEVIARNSTETLYRTSRYLPATSARRSASASWSKARSRARRTGCGLQRSSSTQRQTTISGRTDGTAPRATSSWSRPRSQSRSRTASAAATAWSRRRAGSRRSESRQATSPPTNSISSAPDRLEQINRTDVEAAHQAAQAGGEARPRARPSAGSSSSTRYYQHDQFRGRAGAEPGTWAKRQPNARSCSTRATRRRTPSRLEPRRCGATSRGQRRSTRRR